MGTTQSESTNEITNKNTSKNLCETLSQFLATSQFDTYDNAVPFHKIGTEDFIPAIDRSLAQARVNVQKIKDIPASFEATVVGLETSSEHLDFLSVLYFNLFSVNATEDLRKLAPEISSKSAAFSSEILLDDKLFEKVKTVYDTLDRTSLSSEQRRLLEKLYRNFTRNGALLTGDKKERLKQIDQELAGLGPQFSENVLKATNEYSMLIENKSELEGIPESYLEAAAQEDADRGQKGKWVFTLQAPSIVPFLKYCKSSDLRKQIWIAYNSRAFQGSFDNQENIKKIITLRDERAKLLGYEDHAGYVLDERMAKSKTQVQQFLESLRAPSAKAARVELEELKTFKKEIDGGADLNPWDVAYYSEKLKKARYDFNEELIRPYLQLENVLKGTFDLAGKLFNIKFEKRTDIPLYHPEVECFEVTCKSTGKYFGLLYTDFFPRETKRSGAWATTYKTQGLFNHKINRPHSSIVCNFTKPTATQPSLLSLDEAETLLHEFGHALHFLMSDCTYVSMTSSNVLWDFVELPSQIMENWLRDKESIGLFAKHYVTGEALPADLIKKIQDSERFQAGMASLRQIGFALLDLNWHSTSPKSINSIADFEDKSADSTRLFPSFKGINLSCSFSHIFAGGYAAGYYSYKWAEVLDADAFEYFKEKGLFSKEVAGKFLEHILSKGDTEHPLELFRKFRGRDPDPKALLRRDGLDEK